MRMTLNGSPEDWIPAELKRLHQQALERRLSVSGAAGGVFMRDGRRVLNFASNDYLNLARHPEVVANSEAALRRYGAGAGSSRLLAGTFPCHAELEERLARFKGYPAALVLGSGFLANLAAVTALVGRGDHVFLDRLCHASLVDAAIMSRATVHRFRHNDPNHLAELLATAGKGRRLVVTESVFSMDGDLAPLRELAAVAKTAGTMLLVDEAHATGVFGPGGAGLVREFGVESSVTISMGTLSKALGGYGGFLACSEPVRDWLIHCARAFIFTTALPPAACGAAWGALEILERNPDLGRHLLARADVFREQLRALGLETGASVTPIIPVLFGENERALRVAAALRERGILAPAIRPPTVPAGTARLRLSVTLAHPEEELAWAAAALAEVVRGESRPRALVSNLWPNV